MGIDRSSVVKTVALAGTALAAAEALSGCASPKYVVETVAPSEVTESMSDRFTMLTEVGKEVYVDPIRRLVDEKADSGKSLNKLVWSREDTKIDMYFLDDSYEVPSEELLNAMWDFLETQYNSNFLFIKNRRFDPVTSGVMYIGDLDIDEKYPQARTVAEKGSVLQPKYLPRSSIVATRSAVISDPLATEFCQLMLGGASIREQLQEDGEVECNKFGIAAYAAKKNLSYEEYEKLAVIEGVVPDRELGQRKILLTAYNSTTYDYLRNNVFNKDTAPEVDKKNSMIMYVSEMVVLAREYNNPKYGVMIGIDEYLSSIYDEQIKGNLENAIHFANGYLDGALL